MKLKERLDNVPLVRPDIPTSTDASSTLSDVSPASVPRTRQLSVLRFWQENTFSPVWLTSPWRRPAVGYSAAIILPVLTALLSWFIALDFPTFGLRGIFLLFSGLIVAYLWGTGPGLFSTLIQAFLSNLVRTFPAFTWAFSSQAFTEIVLYLLIEGLLGLLISRLEYARYSAQQARQQIEQTAKQLEQEKTQAAKRASELEAIIAAIADEIYVYDASGHVLRSNHSAQTFNPYMSQEDYLTRPFFERSAVFKPRDKTGKTLPLEQIPVSRVLRGETLTGAQTTDILLRNVNGDDQLFNIGGAPIYDSDGCVQGAVIVMRDITARQQLEQKSATQARELSTLLETVPDAITVFDLEGRIIQLNGSAQKLLSRYVVNVHEPVAQRYRQIQPLDLHGQPLNDQTAPVLRILREETLAGSGSQDITVHTFADEDLWLNIAGAPLYDAQGKLVGGVTITRDLTDQRRATQRTREALQALLQFAEALVEAEFTQEAEGHKAQSGSGVDLVAQQLVALMSQVLGYREVSLSIFAETSQEPLAMAVYGLAPEQERAWRERRPGFTLGELLKGTELEQRLLAGEARVLDLSQPPFSEEHSAYGPLRFLLVPMMLDRRPRGIVTFMALEEDHEYTEEEIGLARALAELAVLTLERQRLFQQHTQDQAIVLALRETNRIMDEFIGIAGHELRTPLTTIKGSVQLAIRQVNKTLQQQEKLPAEIVPALLTIQRNLDRTERQISMQNRLVSDLLDVARIHANRLELYPDLCDLAHLVRESVEDQRYILPARSIELNWQAPEEVLVRADADRVRQVVGNYLNNALKYSDANRPVEVRIELSNNFALVSVHDEGPGISQEQQEHIWERFYRVPDIEVKSGSGVGLGLGLHICRMIIERHDGQVGVQSAPGEGSIFWFTLPLAETTENISLKSGDATPCIP